MAVGDRKCFTVVLDSDPSIFSSYCAKLEELTFDGSQATVTVRINDREDSGTGVVIDPTVTISIGGQTVYDQVTSWPPPGSDDIFIQESASAQAGDIVQVVVTDTDEQFALQAEVGATGGAGAALGERSIQALMTGAGLVGLGVALR